MTEYIRDPEGRVIPVPEPLSESDGTEPLFEQEDVQLDATGADEGVVEPSQPPVVAPVQEQEQVLEQAPPDELADLFEVPQSTDNDMAIEHLLSFDEEDADMNIDDLVDDDISDLTSVSREDVMGAPPKPRPRLVRRTTKPYVPPPTSLGGMR